MHFHGPEKKIVFDRLELLFTNQSVIYTVRLVKCDALSLICYTFQ